MYFLLMAEVYYGMFEEPSKILFFVGLPNQMRIQSDWGQKIILPLDMINFARQISASSLLPQLEVFVLKSVGNKYQFELRWRLEIWGDRNLRSHFTFWFEIKLRMLPPSKSHVSLPLLPLLSRWFSFLDMDWRADPLTKWILTLTTNQRGFWLKILLSSLTLL